LKRYTSISAEINDQQQAEYANHWKCWSRRNNATSCVRSPTTMRFPLTPWTACEVGKWF